MERVHKCLIAIGLYALAMAYVESAVVVYLRTIYEIDDLLQDMPQMSDQYMIIETGREAATMVMLLIIGWVTGRRWQDRIGYFIFAFGLWDIFYYIWLNIFIGWPKTILDWDVLFLIPLPWWGPVLSPMLIALLLVAGGGLAVVMAEKDKTLRFTSVEWSVAGASVLLALYVFMLDAIRALPGGIEAVKASRPTIFDWPMFIIALLGMIFSLIMALWKSFKR
jgi:hypothetical protein